MKAIDLNSTLGDKYAVATSLIFCNSDSVALIIHPSPLRLLSHKFLFKIVTSFIIVVTHPNIEKPISST